jgi:hypothetical protein
MVLVVNVFLLAFDFSCTKVDLQGTYVHMLILHVAQFSLIVIVYLWLNFFLDESFAYALVPICYGRKKNWFESMLWFEL